MCRSRHYKVGVVVDLRGKLLHNGVVKDIISAMRRSMEIGYQQVLPLNEAMSLVAKESVVTVIRSELCSPRVKFMAYASPAGKQCTHPTCHQGIDT